MLSLKEHTLTHVGSENGSWGLVHSQHLLKLGHSQPSRRQPFSLWMDGLALLASGQACQNGTFPTLAQLKAQNLNACVCRVDFTGSPLRAVINRNPWRRQQGCVWGGGGGGGGGWGGGVGGGGVCVSRADSSHETKYPIIRLLPQKCLSFISGQRYLECFMVSFLPQLHIVTTFIVQMCVQSAGKDHAALAICFSSDGNFKPINAFFALPPTAVIDNVNNNIMVCRCVFQKCSHFKTLLYMILG